MKSKKKLENLLADLLGLKELYLQHPINLKMLEFLNSDRKTEVDSFPELQSKIEMLEWILAESDRDYSFIGGTPPEKAKKKISILSDEFGIEFPPVNSSYYTRPTKHKSN